jgi:Bacterial toxin 33
VKDPRFVDALLGLGGAYAALDPVASEAISQDPKLFLDTLWQANSQAEIQVGGQGLSNFTQNTHGVDYLFDLLAFETDMLTSFKLLPVQGQMRSPLYLADLIDAGKKFVHAQYAEDVTQDVIEPSSFFDEVWATSVGELSVVAANDLRDFFEEYQEASPEFNVVIDSDIPEAYDDSGTLVAAIVLALPAVPVVILTAKGIVAIKVTFTVVSGVIIAKWYNEYGQQISREVGRFGQDTTEKIINRVRELFAKTSSEGEGRNPKDDRLLSPGEIKALNEKGRGKAEALKGGKKTGQWDLYKDKKGDIYIKPKGGRGSGEPTGENINDYL